MTLESYVSYSIINLEQACVLTELTHSESYLMWDKKSYILQTTTQLMAISPPLAIQIVSSKWPIVTKRYVLGYVKKVSLLMGLHLMLLGEHFHILLSVHLHLPPFQSEFLQWPHGFHMMLPGVHFHIFLPVHLHLPPSQSDALQGPHGLHVMLPGVHFHTILPVHLYLPPSQ